MSNLNISCTVKALHGHGKKEQVALCKSKTKKPVAEKALRQEALAVLKDKGVKAQDVYSLIETNGAKHNVVALNHPTQREVLKTGLMKPKAKFVSVLVHAHKK